MPAVGADNVPTGVDAFDAAADFMTVMKIGLRQLEGRSPAECLAGAPGRALEIATRQLREERDSRW